MADGPLVEASSAVAGAAAGIAQEHAALEQLVGRLRSARELHDFVAALEELNKALVAHFAHEEEPEGLYDTLGVCVPERREALAELVDEHYRLTAAARSLAERGRWLQERVAGLREEAADLASALDRHERREHDLLRKATGSG